MKKIITAVLTVFLILGVSTAAYAQPKEKDTKITTTQIKKDDKKTVSKSNENKNNGLEKAKQALLKKCDEMIAQINKLKGFIIGSDGKFLVEFKDQVAGDAALKSIDEAVKKVEDFKKRIEAAASTKDLKDISKELQNNWMKHQTIVKRITGLTSAARLKAAYEQTKAVVDKVGTGINAIQITTDASIVIDLDSLKKEHEEIVANLEEARADYLEAVAMFSSINDSAKSDKDFKDAQKKLMEAKDGLHDALSDVKKLLVKIKTSVHKQLDAIVSVKDDDDENDEEDN